ncbi:hypothetical protein OG349_32900 [Streptomyces sp. NBC_01317]|uniref:hypothetical protein n=1 Tax=Streptomyces sp. NBC_01317 TaxID=2903822 RepID=UPI002E0F1D6F|nr:hypothetical protein OG349_32900 [Streptomyces sp. NBC_01317]
MSLDPHLDHAAEDRDGSRPRPPDDAALAALTGLTDTGTLSMEPGQEPIRTLLWTAATERPLEEVAALVSLLRRTGEVPSPGDEALRAAAVARPLEEVMQLVALLHEPPHEFDEADTTLRAAAVGRPIEDVAELVNIFGGDEGESARSMARPGVTADAAAADAVETDTTEAGDDRDGDARADAPARAIRRAGIAAAFSRPAPASASAPAPAPAAAAAAAAAAAGVRPQRRAGKTAVPAPASALRSVLRWPTVALLVVCAVLHLPTDYTRLGSGSVADVLSLALTVVCLVSAVWLAVRDSVRLWVAGASAALAVVVAQAVSAVVGMDLLSSSLGTFPGASVVAVVCAVAAVGLAGTALTLRRQAAVAARA